MRKLSDTDAMLNVGKESDGEVLQSQSVSELTRERGRGQYGGMKPDDVKRLKTLEDE